MVVSERRKKQNGRPLPAPTTKSQGTHNLQLDDFAVQLDGADFLGGREGEGGEVREVGERGVPPPAGRVCRWSRHLSTSAPHTNAQSRRRWWRCRTRCRCRPVVERGGEGKAGCVRCVSRREAVTAPRPPTHARASPRGSDARRTACRRAACPTAGRANSGHTTAAARASRGEPPAFPKKETHRKPQQQARLADARVADEQQLEEVVAGVGWEGGEGEGVGRWSSCLVAQTVASLAPHACAGGCV